MQPDWGDWEAELMVRADVSERLSVEGARFGDTGRATRGQWLIVGGLTVAAAIVCAVHLGSHDIWLDEAYSVRVAGLHGSTFWHTLVHGDPNMTLYYLLLHFWLPVGSSEAAVRALSVLWTIATVPLLYLLARRLLGPTVGWISCGLYTLNSFAVTYAQQARGYSLLAFLAVCSTLLFVRALDDPSPQRWVTYVVVSALAPYVHLYGLLVPASHVAFLVVLPGARRIWKQAAACFVAIAALMVPLAVGVLVNGTSMESWGTRPTPRTVLDVASALSGGRLLLLMFACGALVAIAGGLMHRSADPAMFRAIGLLVCWLVVPAAIGFLVSQLKPEFVDKYLIVSLPPLLIVVAQGMTRAAKRPLAIAAFGVVGAASLWSLYGYYRSPPQESWRAAVGYIASHAGRSDLVDVPAEGLPLGYYLARNPHPFGAEILPTWVDPSGSAAPSRPIESLNRIYVVLGPSDIFDPGPWRAGAARLSASAFSQRDSHVFAGQRGDIRVLTYSR